MENKMGIKILTQGLQVNVRTINNYHFFVTVLIFLLHLSPRMKKFTTAFVVLECPFSTVFTLLFLYIYCLFDI